VLRQDIRTAHSRLQTLYHVSICRFCLLAPPGGMSAHQMKLSCNTWLIGYTCSVWLYVTLSQFLHILELIRLFRLLLAVFVNLNSFMYLLGLVSGTGLHVLLGRLSHQNRTAAWQKSSLLDVMADICPGDIQLARWTPCCCLLVKCSQAEIHKSARYANMPSIRQKCEGKRCPA